MMKRCWFYFHFLFPQIVRTLCLFLTPSERKCSRLCRADSSFKYDTGLFVQGLLKVAAAPAPAASPPSCKPVSVIS